MNFGLSDPHNFGKTVTRQSDGWLSKPRPLDLEGAFLDAGAPFRESLDAWFASHGIQHLLPRLTFKYGSFEGLVEEIVATPTKFTNKELMAVGATIALFTYFGISDLHQENIVIGRFGEVPIFAAVDIEAVFQRELLLNQAGLTNTASIESGHAGLKDLRELIASDKNYLEATASIVAGYLHTLDLLSRTGAGLFGSLEDFLIRTNARVRVILRSSQFYFLRLKSGARDEDLLRSEVAQLDRGDIPYYFYTFNEGPDIWYYDTPETVRKCELSLAELSRLNLVPYQTSKDLQAPSPQDYERILKVCALQLLRFLVGGHAEKFSVGTDGIQISSNLERCLIVDDRLGQFGCKVSSATK